MLNGKNFLLIGSSGGIGAAVLKVLHSHGAKTYVANRSPGVEFQIDLTQEATILKLAKHFIDHKIKLDGLVNCSGIHLSGPLTGVTSEEVHQQISANLTGNIFLLRQFLPIFSSQRQGSIVLMSSVSAHRMTRGHAVYTASKAGLEGLVRASAAEYAKRNIRINAVCPGPVKTKMLEKSMEESGVDPTSMVPMGRFIEPDEVGQASAFLLSDLASAVTGVLLPVDGGYMLW